MVWEAVFVWKGVIPPVGVIVCVIVPVDVEEELAVSVSVVEGLTEAVLLPVCVRLGVIVVVTVLDARLGVG